MLFRSPRCTWLEVSVENLESIHNHSAWATLVAADAPAQAATVAPPPPVAPRFGDWLRTERLARGFSQHALAEAMGTSASQVSKVEAGERSLNDAQLERLATLLGQERALICLRAGRIPSELRERIQGDPEGFLRWASLRTSDALECEGDG